MKHLPFFIMFIIVLLCFIIALSVGLERQKAYNNINYSNKLLDNYYADCGTDTECEALEAKLNFDFKKGMN